MGVGGLVLLLGVAAGTAAGGISLLASVFSYCPGGPGDLPGTEDSEAWVCQGPLATWLTELELVLAGAAALAPVAGALYGWYRSEWVWLALGAVTGGVALLGDVLLASGQVAALS